jgi:hypothetical protein
VGSLEHFEVKEGYATFRPEGPTTLPAGFLAILAEAMAVCREKGVTRLLVDTRKLTHAPLTTAQRFSFGEGLAAFWDRSMTLALLCRADQLDPERFVTLVAANRGLHVSAYESEAAALSHLLE